MRVTAASAVVVEQRRPNVAVPYTRAPQFVGRPACASAVLGLRRHPLGSRHALLTRKPMLPANRGPVIGLSAPVKATRRPQTYPESLTNAHQASTESLTGRIVIAATIYETYKIAGARDGVERT